MNNTDLYRNATREELDLALEWAAKEGWNPSAGDADIFWETDPEGFVCVERDGELIATGSIVSYGSFGFMGFFIVRDDLRGQGIGRRFWHWRKERLLERLEAGAAIGMDGVFDMQPFYSKGGFEFTHRNLRMEGVGQAYAYRENIVDLAEVPFGDVLAVDQRCFGFERSAFLKKWINRRDGRALGFSEDGKLQGFGVIRKCLSGYKIGPLFADSESIADDLFASLGNEAAGQSIYLDIPEINSGAVELAKRYGMKEVFGCARMYYGKAPKLPWDNIYGVTTFELG